MHEQRALIRVRPGIEQHSNVINMVVVNGMRERVRPTRLRPVVEQQLEAGGVLGLNRVVEGVAEMRLTIGIRAVLEQQCGQLGILANPGRTVQHRHRPELVAEESVGVCALAQQLARQSHVAEARVADVMQGRPPAWASYFTASGRKA